MTRARAAGAALLAVLARPAAAQARPPEVELFADRRSAIVALPVPSFTRLLPEERALAFWLVASGRAMSRVFAEQKYAPARELLALADTLAGDDQLAPGPRAELRRYRLTLRAQQGPHDPVTGRKTTLALDQAEVLAALRRVETLGPARPDAELVASVAALWPALAAPEVDAVLRLLPAAPQRGTVDRATANGIYQGATRADAEQFGDRFLGLSALVRRDGFLREAAVRAGDGGVHAPGVWAEPLAQAGACLDAALPYAPGPTGEAVRLLATVHRAGTEDALERWLRLVVADVPGPLCLVQGFLDATLDPRGRHGAFGSAVGVTRPELQQRIDQILAAAEACRDALPLGDSLRGTLPTPLRASAVDLLRGEGAFGPVTPRAVLLPPWPEWRERVGARSVVFANVIEAELAQVEPRLERLLCASEDEAARGSRWGPAARTSFLWLRETLGRTLGATTAGRLPAWQEAVLEQARADLIALWLLGEDKIRELRLLPHPDALLAAWELCQREVVARADEPALPVRPGDPELLGRRLWTGWLLARTRAFSRAPREPLQVVVALDDADEARRGAADLLTEIVRIQVQGDGDAADALVREFALPVDAALRDQAARLRQLLPRPRRLALVPAELVMTPRPGGIWVEPGLPPPVAPAALLLTR